MSALRRAHARRRGAALVVGMAAGVLGLGATLAEPPSARAQAPVGTSAAGATAGALGSLTWPEGDGDGVPAPRRAARFWRAARSPQARETRHLLASAEAMLRAASRMTRWSTLCRQVGADAGAAREIAVRRMVLLENAAARADLAARRDPDEPMALLLGADAVEQWERPELGCAVSRKDAEALARYRAVRERFPDVAPELVLTSLAIAASRVGDDEAAIAAYREVIAIAAHQPRRLAMVHGNLAETLMMRGEVRDAVDHYEAAEAAATSADDTVALALARYGLAAALARLGERRAAVEAARRAVEADGDDLDTLRIEGVFFQPEYEVHFYEALGHEARADGTRVPLPHARARPSANEELLTSVEDALARPMPAAALDRLARAVARWLRAEAESAEREGAETAGARTARATAERRAVEAAVRQAAAHDGAGGPDAPTGGAPRGDRAPSSRGWASRGTATSGSVSGGTASAAPQVQDGALPGPLAPEAQRRLRVGNLVAAARAWLRYLGEGGADSRWAAGVRAHLAWLADDLAPPEAARPRPPPRLDAGPARRLRP